MVIIRAGVVICILLVACLKSCSAKPTSHHHQKPKTVTAHKKALAKDFNLAGQDLKACKYNDQQIDHGTIAYQDVCGKFTCTDGYMAWYYFPNARMFEECHVPLPLLKNDDHHLVSDTIPVYATKTTGDKMERVSVVGGPTHGLVEHADDDDAHDQAHTAMMQTTTIDVKAAHEPHGKPIVEVHDPTIHSGAISVTDHGGHHGEVVAPTQ